MASPGGRRHALAVVKGGVNLPAAAAAAGGSADQYCANGEEWPLNVAPGCGQGTRFYPECIRRLGGSLQFPH